MQRVACCLVALPLSILGLLNVEGDPTFDLLLCDRFGDPLEAYSPSGELAFTVPDCAGAKEQDGNAMVCAASASSRYVEMETGGLLELTWDSFLGEFVVTANVSTTNHHAVHWDKVGGERRAALALAREGAGDRIVRWDMATGEVESVLGMQDYFSEESDRGALSTDTDWTHNNAVSTGSSNNILTDSKHLSAVISWDSDSLELQWVLSSEIESSFAFDANSSRFYNPHDAQQLSNSNVLLFDNGNARPASEGGAFSRAVEYQLNFDTMTASLVWSFVLPNFSRHGGSVRRLENGNTMVAQSCDWGPTASFCDMLIFEVDQEENKVATMTLSGGARGVGGYRCDPWESL